MLSLRRPQRKLREILHRQPVPVPLHRSRHQDPTPRDREPLPLLPNDEGRQLCERIRRHRIQEMTLEHRLHVPSDVPLEARFEVVGVVERRVRKEGDRVERCDVPKDDGGADEGELVEEEFVGGCEDLEDEVEEGIDGILMVVIEEFGPDVLVEEAEDGGHGRPGEVTKVDGDRSSSSVWIPTGLGPFGVFEESREEGGSGSKDGFVGSDGSVGELDADVRSKRGGGGGVEEGLSDLEGSVEVRRKGGRR